MHNVMPKDWLPDPENTPTFEQFETEWRLFDALSREQASWRYDVEGIALKRYLLNLPNLNEATLWYARNPRSRLEQSIWNPFRPNSKASRSGAFKELTLGSGSRGACAAIFPEAIGFRHLNILPGEKPVKKLVLHMEYTCTLVAMMGKLYEHSELPDLITSAARYADFMRAFEALTGLELRWPEDHEWTQDPEEYGQGR